MALSRTTKTRFMAVFIAAVMLVSTAGFALISNTSITPQQSLTPQPDTFRNNVVERELGGAEVVAVLRTGRLLLRYFSPVECEPCQQVAGELRQFASSNPEFVYLQIALRNETALTMVGFDGRLVDLSNITVTQDSLLDYLCESGGLRPKECVLREIGGPAETAQ